MAGDGKQNAPVHPKNLNIAWSHLIIRQLQASGCTIFIVSPGMRNGPLISALSQSDLTLLFNIDERSSAYQALGACKASGKPVALVCTSGTAAANYYPAVIEAYYQQLPLIIISADRPYDQSKLDVNQTIIQRDLFGRYCAPTLMLPLPNLQLSPSILMEQIGSLRQKEWGPIHINVPFEEPLHGQVEHLPPSYLEHWFEDDPLLPGPLKANSIDCPLDDLNDSLLVIGALPFAADKKNITALIKRFPGDVYLDISSGLKFCCHRPNAQMKQRYRQIIHLGQRLTSKHYFNFLIAQSPSKLMVCNQLQKKLDYFPKGFQKINADPNQLAALLLPLCPQQPSSESMLPQKDSLANIILKELPSQSNLYLANSMAIRLFDQIANIDKQIQVACNRATSGIEGLIASSAGLAQVTNNQTTLVIGDISFLHDCNSLALIKNLPLTIVILNNQGGKIFETLPVSHDSNLLPLIITPHNYNFSGLANQFGLSYKAATPEDFQIDGTRIIEVRI